jgi:hypothetical protein
LISYENLILLSSSLWTINIYLAQNDLQFNNEPLSIVRLHFHPPLEASQDNGYGYIMHTTFKNGISLSSLFKESEMTSPELSKFENVFLESVVDNILHNLEKEGRKPSDIAYLQRRTIIDDVEVMLSEIDTKYQSLVQSWFLTLDEQESSDFEFDDVCFHGKISIDDLLSDNIAGATVSFERVILGHEQKLILYRIAKSLVGLSNLLYGEEEEETSPSTDQLNFIRAEIILKTSISENYYRLDIRSYSIEAKQICDITIME